jgi:hypothetical protein
VFLNFSNKLNEYSPNTVYLMKDTIFYIEILK